jgi:predicted RNase H-like HicB family nuclease
MSFTAVIQKVEEGYIGFVEEIPGANTQGETIEEVRENLKEAIQLVLEANKTFLDEITDKNAIREIINLAS